MNIVEVYGNYGTLSVHRESGFIISAQKFEWVSKPGYLTEYKVDGVAKEYADIAFFNPDTLTHSHMDILSTGYFTTTGHYERPMVFVDDWGWEDAERIAA